MSIIRDDWQLKHGINVTLYISSVGFRLFLSRYQSTPLVNPPPLPPKESPSAPTKQVQTSTFPPLTTATGRNPSRQTQQKRLTLAPNKEHPATKGHFHALQQCRGRSFNDTTSCVRTITTVLCKQTLWRIIYAGCHALFEKKTLDMLHAQGYILTIEEASTKSVFSKQ